MSFALLSPSKTVITVICGSFCFNGYLHILCLIGNTDFRRFFRQDDLMFILLEQRSLKPA